MKIKALACATALCALVSGAAQAFDAASDPAPASGSAAAPGETGARTARSLECSQKADAQSLHGKPRKHFMSECKHGR